MQLAQAHWSELGSSGISPVLSHSRTPRLRGAAKPAKNLSRLGLQRRTPRYNSIKGAHYGGDSKLGYHIFAATYAPIILIPERVRRFRISSDSLQTLPFLSLPQSSIAASRAPSLSFLFIALTAQALTASSLLQTQDAFLYSRYFPRPRHHWLGRIHP